jgi:undecaprenyl-diphosphatase
MDELLGFDRSLFHSINHEWANPYFDAFFPAVTDLHRSPLFIAFASILLALWVWRRRIEAVKWIVVLAIALGLSDGISYRLIKHATQRQRPSEAGLQVDLRTDLHTGTSFPSNHAANMFSGATVLTFAFPAWSFLFYAIAAIVAYSRIYVGVHFPLDVLAGAILGTAVGFVTAKSALRFWRIGRKIDIAQK